MAKYRAVSPESYGLKEETHYLYYASVADGLSTLVFQFKVHLSWNATGKAEIVNSNETFKDRNIKIKAFIRGKQAPANAKGTVVSSLIGYNYTPEVSDTATIGKETAGNLIIEKIR